MTGMLSLAPLETLVVDPVLPPSIRELRLRGVRVGRASVDLGFFRGQDGKSHLDVLRKEGTLHVVRQPPPESISVGLAGPAAGAGRRLAVCLIPGGDDATAG